MKKAELKEIAEKYEMEFLRNNEIEQMIVGVYKLTDSPIPELDSIADEQDKIIRCGGIPKSIVSVEHRILRGFGTHKYTVHCPSNWFAYGYWS